MNGFTNPNRRIFSVANEDLNIRLNMSVSPRDANSAVLIREWPRKSTLKDLFDKTPSYLQDFLWPPTLLKMPSTWMKAFFFSKNPLSSSYFLPFPTLKNFRFLPKNLEKTVEKHFKEKLSFETCSRKKLLHLTILKNFKFSFKKNHLFVRKKLKF